MVSLRFHIKMENPDVTEWLFQHVSAVVHHGGAGTAACGLANGCPTAIIPFFGEWVKFCISCHPVLLTHSSQPFWGNMVETAGAGPKPIPYKDLTSSNLGDAVRFCLSPGAISAAREISMRMVHESGVRTAVESFHRQLPFQTLSCDLLPQLAVNWTLKTRKGSLKLSKIAAEALIEANMIQAKELKL